MKTIMTFMLAACAIGLFTGCESEHHHHRGYGYHRTPDRVYGTPAPGPVVGHGYYQDAYGRWYQR